MGQALRRPHLAGVALFAALCLLPRTLAAADPAGLAAGLTIKIGGVTKTLTLAEAMKSLNIQAVSVALIDEDRIAYARAYGDGVTPETLFQATSLSKFVACVGAMRLVDRNRLVLDGDVNKALTSWRVPANDLDKDHPVTLRGLLSMTAGIGVPGFLGYKIDAPLPTPTQILDGAPPANSPPVTVITVPGSAYHYSGGGYQIAEELMADALHAPFAETMDGLVLTPAGMSHSNFAQPLPDALKAHAVTGHLADGSEVSGGFHVFAEHAARRAWSTPTDIANLLLLMARTWRGERGCFSSRRPCARCSPRRTAVRMGSAPRSLN